MLGRRRNIHLLSVLAASAALTFTACASPEAPTETTDNTTAAQDALPTDTVEIPTGTPVGVESQRILDTLNADEDTTAQDWEARLHDSFTAEVSVEELVELFNQNLRPAQPFTVTDYEGGDRQAVTTLTSPVSEPLDMTVVLDTDDLITGLFFGESQAAG